MDGVVDAPRLSGMVDALRLSTLLFATDFRDRVVHHVLVDFLEAIWELIFIRQATANGTRPAWYLQLDT